MGKCILEIGDVFFIENIVKDFKYVVKEGDYILINIENINEKEIVDFHANFNNEYRDTFRQVFTLKSLDSDGTYNELLENIKLSSINYKLYKKTMKQTFK